MGRLRAASIGLCLALLAPASPSQLWVARADRLFHSGRLYAVGPLGLPVHVAMHMSGRFELSEWDGLAWEVTSRFPSFPFPTSYPKFAVDEARGEEIAALATPFGHLNATFVRV